MKKCLITGGAGFIGSHIAEHLANEGANIFVLDSLRTGFEKNLEGLNVNFFKGDIRDEKLFEELTKDCETIFHLAALVIVQ
jgi:UDP-glucose 4-epimerase